MNRFWYGVAFWLGNAAPTLRPWLAVVLGVALLWWMLTL